MVLIAKFVKCGGGVCLRRGGKEGRNGKFDSQKLHKQNVSSSHAHTRRTSHQNLNDFDGGRLAKYSFFFLLFSGAPFCFNFSSNHISSLTRVH